MKEKVVVASALCRQFEIDNVTVEAVKNLDLTVEEGEFISIYGPSGAGKTTLLNLIGALGAKPKSIMKIVFSQALLIIIVSGATGISSGLFITLEFLIPDPVISQYTLIVVPTLLLVTLLILCISSLYPALKAAKKTVIEAISAV